MAFTTIRAFFINDLAVLKFKQPPGVQNKSGVYAKAYVNCVPEYTR